MEPEPAWSIHLRPESRIPRDPDAARRFLRRGDLPGALLGGAGRPALRVGGTSLTHEQLRRRAQSVAAGLHQLGIDAQSRVGLYGDGGLSWILSHLALQVLGATVVPINPSFKAAEVEHILADSRPCALLLDDPRRSVVEPLRRLETFPRLIPLEDLPVRDEPLQPARLSSESPALILYTSGTTGRPKGALLDHGNLLAQARGVIEAWRWNPDDVLVLALPLFHLHGLAIALHGSLIAGGQAVVIPFTPERVAGELQAGGTMFFGVPAMYQRLAEWLEQHPTDLSHVRLFVSGSAPLAPALFDRCRRLLGQPVLERYGITEGGIVVSNPCDGPRQAGRVGHPLPGVEVRLGREDEILLKGGQVFSGYWGNERATAEIFADGWMRTGDVGELGQDGSLAIRGRLKELIISGGYNVYPREVELVLETHPAVLEVAVIGVPSERWGEEVTAFVVAGSRVSEDELIQHARRRLAPYKCPRAVVLVDALPRNAMGKVQRAALTAARVKAME